VKQITAKLYQDHELFYDVEARIREALHGFVKPAEIEEAPDGDGIEMVGLDDCVLTDLADSE
jgi:hypothetical protein